MKTLWFFLLLILPGSTCAAQTLEPSSLVDGGYILYFRHAKADVGTDCKDPEQPDWWKSKDSSKTRQLSEEGRDQARIIGQAFRRLKIPVGKVLTSEFKRAQDTAELMDIGEPVLESNLTPLVVRGDFRERFESLLVVPPTDGTNTVLVAHGHVLPEFEELDEGSAVVYRAGEKSPVGVITFEQWREAGGALTFDSRVKEDEFRLSDSTLLIRSSRGIGEVTVQPTGKDWPALKVLRFEYSNGQGMKRLEGIQIKTGSPLGQFHYRDLKRELRNGAVEIVLPPELPQSVRFMTIHWVDFYR